MHVQPHHTNDELGNLIKREKDARVATRLCGVLLAARGRTHKKIADHLGVAQRAELGPTLQRLRPSRATRPATPRPAQEAHAR